MNFSIDIIPQSVPPYCIPSVSVILNDEVLLNSVNLSKVNSHGIYTMNFNCDNVNKENTLKILANDISSDPGDNHGLKIDTIRIDNIDMSYFTKYGTVYRPIYDESYINNYIIPNNKMDEIKYKDGMTYHIVSGDYVNYINSINSYYEYKFTTPIIEWLYDIQFGYLWDRFRVKQDEYTG